MIVKFRPSDRIFITGGKTLTNRNVSISVNKIIKIPIGILNNGLSSGFKKLNHDFVSVLDFLPKALAMNAKRTKARIIIISSLII